MVKDSLPTDRCELFERWMITAPEESYSFTANLLPCGRVVGPMSGLHRPALSSSCMSPRLCCMLDELINFAADALRLESLCDQSSIRKRPCRTTQKRKAPHRLWSLGPTALVLRQQTLFR